MSRVEKVFTLKNCELKAETDKAVLIAHDEYDDTWVPRSQIEDIERGDGSFTTAVTMFEWIAKEKGYL